ncbi:MAG: hypothetical protein H8D45_31690, partial [Bacteroidetes bacterium]|nr:hypothetical protein [Bacteroidota bacterium]
MIVNKLAFKISRKLTVIAGITLIILGAIMYKTKWINRLLISLVALWKEEISPQYWTAKIQMLGVDVLLIGIIIVVLGLLIFPRWTFLKQNKLVQLIGKIGVIWLLIVAKVFTFSNTVNEIDVLPSAKQFVAPNWLSNDWYLNLDIGYRHVFNSILGTIVSWQGFQYGSYVARLLVYLLLAIAIYILFRTLCLKFSFGLLILLLFLGNQSLIAGEWIVGGVDTKTISYAFAILSFSFFLRKRYLLGFAFAGAATSFHILVGIYALFCILVATLLNKTWRLDWRRYIYNSWTFFITGFWGLQAIVKQLLADSKVDAAKAWAIYVNFRVPHHVLPSSWNGYLWIAKLTLATALFLTIYFWCKSL